jgi:hypothetical protein
MTCPTDICHRVRPSGILTKTTAIGVKKIQTGPDSHRRTTDFSGLSSGANRYREGLKILLKINQRRCRDATFSALTAAAMRNNGARIQFNVHPATGATVPSQDISAPASPDAIVFFAPQ